MRISAISISVSVPAGWHIHRQFHSQQRSPARFGIDHESSAKMPDPFLHPEQAQAPYAPGVEPSAIVLDAELNPAARAMHRDMNRTSLSVPGAIVQRLLHHAIDARLVLLRQFVVN